MYAHDILMVSMRQTEPSGSPMKMDLFCTTHALRMQPSFENSLDLVRPWCIELRKNIMTLALGIPSERIRHGIIVAFAVAWQDLRAAITVQFDFRMADRRDNIGKKTVEEEGADRDDLDHMRHMWKVTRRQNAQSASRSAGFKYPATITRVRLLPPPPSPRGHSLLWLLL